MHVLIVYAHPERRSFNGALTDVTIDTLTGAGHGVEVADLYAEGFDPIERPAHYPDRADPAVFAPLTEQRHAWESDALPSGIRSEIERLERADLVIFQYPLWWHAQPAILKGWIDRVFVYGGLYTGSLRYDYGYFRGRRALCSVTTGAPRAAFSRYGRNGHMEHLMLGMHYSLYYVGYDVLAPFVAYGIQGGGLVYQEEQRFRKQLDHYLEDWARRLEHVATDVPIPFTGWADWDERGVIHHDHPARWNLQ